MLNVSGNIIAFVHSREVYVNGVPVQKNNLSFTISNKDAEGNYDNVYVELKFPKDLAEELGIDTDFDEGDVLDIDIAEAFLSFRKYQTQDGDDRVVYQLVVTAVNSIDYHEEKPKKQAKTPAKKPAGKPAGKTPAKKALKK